MFKRLFYFFIVSTTLFACQPTDDVTPSTDKRDAYIFTWKSNDYDENNEQVNAYQVKVKKSTIDLQQILISNFMNYEGSNTIYATVYDKGFTIPVQSYYGTTVSGDASLTTSNFIELSYKVVEGSSVKKYTATWQK